MREMKRGEEGKARRRRGEEGKEEVRRGMQRGGGGGGGAHTCLGVYRVLQVKGDINNGPDHLISVPLRGIL